MIYQLGSSDSKVVKIPIHSQTYIDHNIIHCQPINVSGSSIAMANLG